MNEKIHVKKIEKVPDVIKKLKGVSGVYIFHTKGHIWYVGKAECFRHRFVNGYLKGRDSKQHISEGLLQRMELGLELSVVFILIEKDLIGKEEERVIGKACPWLNKGLNPRDSIRGIQRNIGKIVQDSGHEWSYDDIRKHLFYYYSGQIPTNRIEKALANKDSNLSRYCKTVPSKGILKPKNIA